MASDQTHSQSMGAGEIPPSVTEDNPFTDQSLSTPDAGLQTQQKGDARYVCQLGQVSLVFNASLNIEVLLDTAIYRVPNTPGWLLGLCNRRGELVPVFDLRSLLSIKKAVEEKNYLFVVDKDEYAIGFFIDDYPTSVYSITEVVNLPAMPELLKDHVLKAYSHEQQSLLEIDHRSLFKEITKELSSGS